jgi:hypothetical protein
MWFGIRFSSARSPGPSASRARHAVDNADSIAEGVASPARLSRERCAQGFGGEGSKLAVAGKILKRVIDIRMEYKRLVDRCCRQAALSGIGAPRQNAPLGVT